MLPEGGAPESAQNGASATNESKAGSEARQSEGWRVRVTASSGEWIRWAVICFFLIFAIYILIDMEVLKSEQGEVQGLRLAPRFRVQLNKIDLAESAKNTSENLLQTTKPWSAQVYQETLKQDPRNAYFKDDLPNTLSALEAVPKIYVYTLPDYWSNCPIQNAESWRWELYGAELAIPELLKDSPYLTADPEEADFFYVHAHFYCKYWATDIPELNGAGATYQPMVAAMVEWLRKQHPYWDRKNGTDHIFTLTYDQGYCGYAVHEGTANAIAQSVKLSHWGLLSNDVSCMQWERLNNYNRCDKREYELDKVPEESKRPCFNPYQDVVVTHPSYDFLEYVPAADFFPNYTAVRTIDSKNVALQLSFKFETMVTKSIYELAQGKKLINAASDTLHRSIVFLFLGGVLVDSVEYSHGTRQTIHAMFHNEPGFKVIDSNANDGALRETQEELFLDMATSIFCLAATGAGFGVRLKQSIQMGCIPVVAADGVQMPFEDVLPYHDFAIRLPMHMLFRLPNILNTLITENPDMVRAMQERINCVARYLSYTKSYGRILETIMCSLRRKLYGWNNIYPLMDWETCTLHCSTKASLDAISWGESERFSLSDPVQRLALTPGRRG